MTDEQRLALANMINNGGTIPDFTRSLGECIVLQTLEEGKLFFTAYHKVTESFRFMAIPELQVLLIGELQLEIPKLRRLCLFKWISYEAFTKRK